MQQKKALQVEDAENQQGGIARGRARCRAGLPTALKEEKLGLQVAWKRAEGCAGRGAVHRGELGKTEVKGEGAFHMKTCKKQLNAGVLLHFPFSYTVASQEVLGRSPDLHPTAF